MRIRHYGLLANRTRQAKLARARQLLAVVAATPLLSPVSVSATDPAPSPTAAPTVRARTGASSPGSCHNEGIPHDLSPERFSMVVPTIFTARACPHGANDPRVSTTLPSVRLTHCVGPNSAALPPTSVRLSASLSLFARVLTGSVTIGRVRQTL